MQDSIRDRGTRRHDHRPLYRGFNHAQSAAEQITTVSINVSPAFIRGVAHASAALDQTRRLKQRRDPGLKGLRWTLLQDRQRLSAAARRPRCPDQPGARNAPPALGSAAKDYGPSSIAKQINVATAILKQWCTNDLRSKVEAMKDVARMIRRHFDGIVAWTQTRQTNGFIEALNGFFQEARGYNRFATMCTVLFLIAGKLEFTGISPHAEYPHQIQ